MTEQHRDPDLEALRALPARDAPTAVAHRIRAEALVAFDAAHRGPGARAALAATQLWSRAVVPVGLAVVVALYLHWAFAATMALYR